LMIPENSWIQVILICASWYLSKGLSSNVIFQRWDSHGHYNAILAEIIIFIPFSIEILLGSILLNLISSLKVSILNPNSKSMPSIV